MCWCVLGGKQAGLNELKFSNNLHDVQQFKKTFIYSSQFIRNKYKIWFNNIRK